MSRSATPRSLKIMYGVLVLAAIGTAAAFLVPAEKPHVVSSGDIFLRQQKEHPVTEEMLAAADNLSAKLAPEFRLVDTNGTIHTLESLTADRPLLIFFVEKNCPCCLGAKHFVDSLAEMYRDSANVVGIINASGEEAQAWVKETKPHFAVLQDPNQHVIRAFGAERGVYTTIVAPGGTIDKAYAGYSLDMLREASGRIAALAGVPDQGFESPAAPTKLTSGCLFPDVLKPVDEPSTN